MSPILGIYASQISGHLGIPIISSSDYYSIATQTVGSGGASSITFSSIPSTYTHLQLRMMVRETSTSNGYSMQFNGDTGNNYARHYLYGTGSSAAAAAVTSTSSMILADAAISTSTTGVFGASVCDVLDYTNVNKNKVIKTLGGYDNNGNGAIFFNSGLWMNTSSVTSIVINPDAGSFAQYSSFALYGIK